MRISIIAALVVGISGLAVSSAWADVNALPHTLVTYEAVREQETLQQFSERMYGNKKCWPVIASHPENQILFAKDDLLNPALELSDMDVVADTLAVPNRVNCDQILRLFDFPRIPVVREESKTILTYGDRVYESWQHFWNSDSVPFPEFMDSAEGEAKSRAWEHRWNEVYDRDRNTIYGKVDYSYEWEDSFYNAMDGSVVYRVRQGNQWFVVKSAGGKTLEISRPWDYVDQLDVSTISSTYTYRARDIEGKWYLVKNDRVTAVSFEPEYIFFNEILDEPFAINDKSQSAGRVFSVFGDWNFAARPVRVASVDARGNMLFSAYTKVPLAIRSDAGINYNMGSSSQHRYEDQYWLNDTYVGASNFNVYPLYSQSGAFSWATDDVFFTGVPHAPSFDSNGNMIVYSVYGRFPLYRTVFDVSALKRF